MRQTLIHRVRYSDQWTERRFLLLSQPLGTVGDAAALEEMERQHRNQGKAAMIALLHENAAITSGRKEHRVVRQALFGEGACRGFGNAWSEPLQSRSRLLAALRDDQAAASATVETRAVQCLRGLLGHAAEIPALGSVSSERVQQ